MVSEENSSGGLQLADYCIADSGRFVLHPEERMIINEGKSIGSLKFAESLLGY